MDVLTCNILFIRALLCTLAKVFIIGAFSPLRTCHNYCSLKLYKGIGTVGVCFEYDTAGKLVFVISISECPRDLPKVHDPALLDGNRLGSGVELAIKQTWMTSAYQLPNTQATHRQMPKPQTRKEAQQS